MLLNKYSLAFNKLLLIWSLLQVLFQKRRGFRIADLKRVEQAYFEFRCILWLQYHKTASEIFSNFHEAAIVLKHPTVVWRTEYGYKLSVCKELIAIINDQMTSANQINFIFVTEILYNFLVECEADATFVFFPVGWCRFWITPKHVAEKAGIWNIRRPFDI